MQNWARIAKADLHLIDLTLLNLARRKHLRDFRELMNRARNASVFFLASCKKIQIQLYYDFEVYMLY